jgi:hypothetical protein
MSTQLTNHEFKEYLAGLERARLSYVKRHLELLGANPVVAVFHQHDTETGALRYIYYVHHTEHSGRNKWQLSFVYVDADGRQLPTTHEIYKTLEEVLTELHYNRAELVEVRQVRPTASNPNTPKLVREAAAWWVGYCWDRNVKTISPAVEKYLAQFTPDRPVTLYRFELANHDPKKRPIQWPWVSWSHDKKMVEEIVEMENEEQDRGLFRVVRSEIPPELVFTDYTHFPGDLKREIEKVGGDSGMSEVLVYVNKRPTASNPPQIELMTARVGEGMKGLVYPDDPGLGFFSWFINPLTGAPHHLDAHEQIMWDRYKKNRGEVPPNYTLAYVDNNIDVVITSGPSAPSNERLTTKEILSRLDVTGNPWVSVWRGATGVWRGTVADFRAQADLLTPLSRSTAQNPDRRGPAKAELLDGPLSPGMKGQAYLNGDKIEIVSWFTRGGSPHHRLVLDGKNPIAFLTFISGDEYGSNRMLGCYLNSANPAISRDPYNRYTAALVEFGFTGKQGDDDLEIGVAGMSVLLSTTVGEYLRKVHE